MPRLAIRAASVFEILLFDDDDDDDDDDIV